jgi:hypothetical protein
VKASSAAKPVGDSRPGKDQFDYKNTTTRICMSFSLVSVDNYLT